MTQENEDQIMKSQMEKMVDSYDSYMKRATFGREQALRQMTVELAGVKSGDCVLEVGCGTGSLTIAAKRQAGPSGKLFGIDIITGMIEVSRRKAAEAHEEITFQEGSIDNIPFSADQFDVVMCSFMLFHMSEETRRKGISEIQRVLKPGGRLLVMDLALPTRPIQRAIAQRLLGFSSQDDLRDLLPLLEATGFSDLKYGQAKFRVFGLSLIGYVCGNARKT